MEVGKKYRHRSNQTVIKALAVTPAGNMLVSWVDSATFESVIPEQSFPYYIPVKEKVVVERYANIYQSGYIELSDKPFETKAGYVVAENVPVKIEYEV